MHLTRKCLLLGLSAKHSSIDEERAKPQHDEEDDAEYEDDAGVTAGPVVSFQELMGVLEVVGFADDSHRERFR